MDTHTERLRAFNKALESIGCLNKFWANSIIFKSDEHMKDLISDGRNYEMVIKAAFVWEDTREGHAYWKDIANKIRLKYGK